jgi:hypothetical protein
MQTEAKSRCGAAATKKETNRRERTRSAHENGDRDDQATRFVSRAGRQPIAVRPTVARWRRESCY